MKFISGKKNIIKGILILFSAVLILKYPSETAFSAVNSINVCLNSIIPSMFIFMVLSTYTLISGAYRTIFRPVIPFLRHIIRADDNILSVFLLSLVGGYPIGPKLLREFSIYDRKNVSTAEHAAMFCYCISPSFAIIMLGEGVFGSTHAGLVIYISDILGCLIAGMIVSRKHYLFCSCPVSEMNGSLTDAINSTSRSLMTVCAVIIAFNSIFTGIKCIAEDFGINISPLTAGIFEISNLLEISSPEIYLLPLISAISSFGGICVLPQCVSVTGGTFPIKKMILSRIPCAIMSALISFIILQFSDISVRTSAFSGNITYDFSANKVIVIILTAMCIIIFNKSDKNIKKV